MIEPNSLVVSWLEDEYSHINQKFGKSQVEHLQASPLSDDMNFGGLTASYWKRMCVYGDGDEGLLSAQAAAKMASSARSLWSTIRSIDRESDIHATADSIYLIDDHFIKSDFREIKPQLEKSDFWETSIGLGLTYLEANIRRKGFLRKFRLGQLLMAEQIMYDASDALALQFERTLEDHGNLPRPGLSSGNIELWLPETKDAQS